MNIEHSCITFDHPLHVKAFQISKSLQINIAISLVQLQLTMNFLGSTRGVLEGSRLKDWLGSICAPETAVHMLNGKALGEIF